MKQLLTFALILTTFIGFVPAQTTARKSVSANPPAGYWSLEKSQPIIDKTQTIRLALDVSNLNAPSKNFF